MITRAQKQQFIEQGFLVAKALLDVEADIEPFKQAYTGFARSRRAPERELRDAQLWSEMWRAALDFLSENPHAAHDGDGLGLDEAAELTARWAVATRDYRDWLRLSEADFPRIRQG
jgi:hypothetical protein